MTEIYVDKGTSKNRLRSWFALRQTQESHHERNHMKNIEPFALSLSLSKREVFQDSLKRIMYPMPLKPRFPTVARSQVAHAMCQQRFPNESQKSLPHSMSPISEDALQRYDAF